MNKIPYPRLRQAQIGLVILFFVMGFSALSTVAWVPEFIRRLDLDFAQWGSIVGLGIIGSIAPLFIVNKLILRFGTLPIIRIGSVLFATANVGLGLTNNVIIWFFVNVSFLFSLSVLNIAVNAHSVMLQRLVGRNIIGRFHAAWSAGAALAAVFGGLMTAFMDLTWYLVMVSAFAIIGLQWGAGYLLPPALDGHLEEKQQTGKSKPLHMPGILWLLSLGLFAGVFPETVIIDWSALYASGVMNLESTLAAIPFAAFTIGMIAGRLSMTRLTKRFNASEIARWGSYLAAFTLSVSILFGPTISSVDVYLGLAFTMLFWLMAGLGVAPIVPAYFSAGAHVEGLSTASVLARMSLFHSVVSIGAKALMGALAEGFDLATAFIFPILLLVLTGIIARQVVKFARKAEMASSYPATGAIGIVAPPDPEH